MVLTATTSSVVPLHDATPPRQPAPHLKSMRWWTIRQGKKRFEAKVTRNWFRFYWVMFVLFYLVDGLFLVGVSKLYFWMLYQPIVVLNVETVLQLLPISTLRVLVWVFPLLAAGHLLTVLEILVNSCKQRRLVLTSPAMKSERSDSVVGRALLAPEASPSPGIRRKIKTLLRKWVYPFVNLDGRHYEVWFAIQEIFQIVSQTYQCYSMSRLVATKWMNQLALLCTFLNCVSSPVIRFLIPSDIPRQRFFCVLIDCCMGFIQIVVIPCIIFWPYYVAFDTGDYYYSEELVYDIVWYVEMVHKLDQVFIVSYFDFFTTALPHFGFLHSLRNISDMLHMNDSVEPSGTMTMVVPVGPKAGATQAKNIVPPDQPSIAHSSMGQERKKRFKLSGSFLYGSWCILHGLVIVILHFAASNNDETASINCLSRTNPWFTQKYACSVINIDCYHSNIRGTAVEVTILLQKFDPHSASSLLFSNCPNLEMPPMFLDFPGLLGVDIFNTTLVKWSSEAALNRDSHPVFSYIYFDMTNLTVGIPEGILGDNLPTSFSDIEFFHTNLTTLPSDLGSRWLDVNCLYLEFCELTELPHTLVEMPLVYFSAVGNHIEQVDDTLFENNAFSQFWLSNNPLQKFPSTVGDLTELCEFVIEDAPISVVPDQVIDWALDRQDRQLYIQHSVNGTLFCNSTDTSETSDSRVARYKGLFCAESLNSSKGYFPIEIIESLHMV